MGRALVRQTVRGAVAGLAVCVLVGAPACAQEPVAATAPPPVAGPASTAPADPARPDHVVIVVLENKNEPDVAREAPYLTSLARSGVAFTDMHAETHPSQPNYLALFSGGTQGVDDDSCPHTFDAPTLAGQLAAAGYSFAGYAEDLPEPGFTGCAAGDYARKHSPWTNFRDVPAQSNLPLSAMPTDYAQLPTVSFLIPNLCHDMHDCSIAEGDRWLAQNVDGYAQWARTHNSLLIVTFDESEDDDDNHISTFAVGQRVTPGVIGERTDHYRILRTLQDLYGLAPLGHSAEAAPVAGLWRTGA
jgi:phosphatidylinositol-3-phosphatase